MPTPYDLITNERLRGLVQKSPSILSLAEEERAALIERLVHLPPEGQQQMIALLEEEAATFASGKVVTLEEKQKMMADGLRTINFTKKDFKKKILADGEKVEIDQSTLAAEQLLQKL